MSVSHRPQSVAIVGGGITGLTAAYYLYRAMPSTRVTVLESAPSVGGVLRTERRNGYLIEASADSMLTTPQRPWGAQLVRDLGLTDDQLIPTNRRFRRALVAYNSQLHPIPDGFQLLGTSKIGQLWKSRLLSWRGKLRLAAEPFVPRRISSREESLQEFARRRVGHEAYERLVQPLVAGIYSADPTKLSVPAALPEFAQLEQQYGSLWRALRRRARHQASSSDGNAGARYSMFMAPRDGMASLISELKAQLPPQTVKTNVTVKAIQPKLDPVRWQVHANEWAAPETYEALILATPAFVAARLLEFDGQLARPLERIPYAGVAVVCLAYHRSHVSRGLEAFGIVVPLVTRRRILAVSFSSVKFAGRAPADHVLMRVFVGGACQPELLDLDDAELKVLVQDELDDLIGPQGPPIFCDVHRWPRSTPQYHVGHLELIGQIEASISRWPGLAVAGSAYNGIGIPQCIGSAQNAANRIHKHLMDVRSIVH